MGAGFATSKSGKTYIVAKYLPPGNVTGGFEKNVLPKKWSNPSRLSNTIFFDFFFFFNNEI